MFKKALRGFEMNKRLTKILLILLCLLIGLSIVSFAQRQTGSIKGTITDAEGNVLPGITVTTSSEAMMGIKSYVTGGTGAFRFPALSPGTYTLRAEMPGFNNL